MSQLQSWLAVDGTNEFQYIFPDFICQDYAATLMLHARTQEWQMGLVNVYGYDTNTRVEWNHALNAIITTEGLVYVEPQNDRVWCIPDMLKCSLERITGCRILTHHAQFTSTR